MPKPFLDTLSTVKKMSLKNELSLWQHGCVCMPPHLCQVGPCLLITSMVVKSNPEEKYFQSGLWGAHASWCSLISGRVQGDAEMEGSLWEAFCDERRRQFLSSEASEELEK